ncbi:MAG: gamma-glutamylcyclotransferase [Candidatus Andeanibacterium colombiense]|uniref:Gamma-glutamylcyclotransferase n=1 Tax=Candidatus Andeanibacterium colombiense TaxID=3121345 RepID=A0AAJ6BM27_9SPHN|nr:MAG: gamma-glutamylcyclotransferase [Sphingomonadaceae bacterium]
MARHFFFYGTLRRDLVTAPSAKLIEGLELVGPATLKGRIFAKFDPRGAYPVLLRDGIGTVHGIVCRGGERFTIRSLAALDRYEGAARAGGEYVRRPMPVMLGRGGAITADAYLYTRRVTPDLIPIPHGDFARWLAETGERPFG